MKTETRRTILHQFPLPQVSLSLSNLRGISTAKESLTSLHHTFSGPCISRVTPLERAWRFERALREDEMGWSDLEKKRGEKNTENRVRLDFYLTGGLEQIRREEPADLWYYVPLNPDGSLNLAQLSNQLAFENITLIDPQRWTPFIPAKEGNISSIALFSLSQETNVSDFTRFKRNLRTSVIQGLFVVYTLCHLVLYGGIAAGMYVTPPERHTTPYNPAIGRHALKTDLPRNPKHLSDVERKWRSSFRRYSRCAPVPNDFPLFAAPDSLSGLGRYFFIDIPLPEWYWNIYANGVKGRKAMSKCISTPTLNLVKQTTKPITIGSEKLWVLLVKNWWIFLLAAALLIGTLLEGWM
ncbi:hypothetical protein BDQ12DRAFT_715780 [Crucibulum laeve]|uniref:Uncharacterized protein n=1 Tax=Crucibulum laeve TaxID=68775 RepID=A0A5C3LLF1_9AGAR|nr:hypothetical protein BDQ12DRAFT_715780 [Crucibulum laeve]